MPSYIEFLKQETLPAASDPSKVVFGITDQGGITVSNELGSIVGGTTVTTDAEGFFDSMMGGTLSPGTLYYISNTDGYDLYGGTDVIVQALTTSSFDPRGIGKFYNPNYNKNIDGYGIWSEYTRFYVNLDNGIFDVEETITGDGGQTALLVASVSDGGLTFVTDTTGDWSTATSFTGSNSGATATIIDVFIPSYAINDKVIWGGKVWINNTGEVGSFSNDFELDNINWEVVPYNDTDYTIVWDKIEYDAVYGFITMRCDKANNTVRQTYNEWYDVNDWRGIALFPWGNEYDPIYTGTGLGNNIIDGNSFVNLINFRGIRCVNNTFTNDVGFGNNTFEIGVTLERNKFDDCGVYGNFFGGDNFYIEDNDITYSGFYSNIGNGYGAMYGNKFHDSYIAGNYILDSEINYNYLEDSGLYDNQVLLGDYYSQIIDNKLHYASINNNTLHYSYIYGNTLNSDSYISYNVLDNDSEIYYNTLSNSSNIQNSNLDGEYINNNALFNSSNVTNAVSNQFFANL